jgi:hypothetical protein
MADAKLMIVWDGKVPGLADHRLSLAAFGQPLKELVYAIRRVASDLEREAKGRLASGLGVGRNTKDASLLDVQVITIRGNSPVTVECSIVPMAQPQYPLLETLSDRAMLRLLEDIEMETSGRPAHFKVRQFVKSLPEGLEAQRYTAFCTSGETRTVDVGAIRLAQEPPALAHLTEFHGGIASLNFERRTISFRTVLGDAVNCSATDEQISEAIKIRELPVLVLAVTDGHQQTRLLRLLTEGHERQPTSADNRLARVIQDWDPLLAILAK